MKWSENVYWFYHDHKNTEVHRHRIIIFFIIYKDEKHLSIWWWYGQQDHLLL